MKKITKIQGQKELASKKSKMVISTTGSLDQFLSLLDKLDKEDYLMQVESCPHRIAIKYNNNEVVFQILNGTQEKTHSWLTGLKGSAWYKVHRYDVDFIIIVESDNCYITVYQLLN